MDEDFSMHDGDERGYLGTAVVGGVIAGTVLGTITGATVAPPVLAGAAVVGGVTSSLYYFFGK